jgi:hypothetical protein
MSHFDWHSDKDSDAMVLGYQPPTAIYRTKSGSVVIRQKAYEMEEYDPQVFLTPQGALAVAWRLIEEAHLEGLPSPSLSLMTESEHWPPAGRRTKAEVPAEQNQGSAPGPLLQVMQAAE